jgi:hypothetical protein
MSETGCICRATSRIGCVPDIYVASQYVQGDTTPFGETQDNPGDGGAS